jgi:hypothetical protein
MIPILYMLRSYDTPAIRTFLECQTTSSKGEFFWRRAYHVLWACLPRYILGNKGNQLETVQTSAIEDYN